MLFIHGKKDSLIPHVHSQRLRSLSANEGSHLHLSETMEHNCYELYEDIINPVFAFWRKLSMVEVNTQRAIDVKAIEALQRTQRERIPAKWFK